MPSKTSSTLTPRRLAYRLHRARQDPRSVVVDPLCRGPGFCLPFFDLCEAVAYEAPPSTPPPAAFGT
jgi:hypothetical protein